MVLPLASQHYYEDLDGAFFRRGGAPLTYGYLNPQETCLLTQILSLKLGLEEAL